MTTSDAHRRPHLPGAEREGRAGQAIDGDDGRLGALDADLRDSRGVDIEDAEPHIGRCGYVDDQGW